MKKIAENDSLVDSVRRQCFPLIPFHNSPSQQHRCILTNLMEDTGNKSACQQRGLRAVILRGRGFHGHTMSCSQHPVRCMKWLSSGSIFWSFWGRGEMKNVSQQTFLLGAGCLSGKDDRQTSHSDRLLCSCSVQKCPLVFSFKFLSFFANLNCFCTQLPDNVHTWAFCDVVMTVHRAGTTAGFFTYSRSSWVAWKVEMSKMSMGRCTHNHAGFSPVQRPWCRQWSAQETMLESICGYIWLSLGHTHQWAIIR